MFKKKRKHSLARSLSLPLFRSLSRARARGDVVDAASCCRGWLAMLVDSQRGVSRAIPNGRPATVTRAFSLFVRALNREFARGRRDVRRTESHTHHSALRQQEPLFCHSQFHELKQH